MSDKSSKENETRQIFCGEGDCGHYGIKVERIFSERFLNNSAI